MNFKTGHQMELPVSQGGQYSQRMLRREFLATSAAPLLRAAGGSRPNLLLIMSDQHRADCLGASGNAVIRTPNLDHLAAGGVRFSSAFSSTPTCTPARAALLTGMSPWSHGMLGYSQVAQKYPVEMPRLLREAGYFTTGIGKMHWTPQRNLHGFHQTILDESGRVESVDFRSDYRSWFWSEMPGANPDATGLDWNGYTAAEYALPERMHPTRWTGDVAVRFLKEYQRPEPFFLKVSFARPHSPYDPPKRFMDLYRDADLPPANVAPWADRYRERSGNDVTIWHGDLGRDMVRRARQGYYGNVSFVDEQVGRILETLAGRGLAENTLVIFLSDHGDMLGDHHLWRKSYGYDASSRIPMILRSPGLKPGVVSRPVEIRDVLPTLLDAAGVSTPGAVEGRSLLKPAEREWIDLEHDVCYSAENHWNGLTDGRVKYIFHARSGEEQLLDERDRPTGDEAAMQLWRSRMVGHLEARGEGWVRGGRLMTRPKSQLHSPHYPDFSGRT